MALLEVNDLHTSFFTDAGEVKAHEYHQKNTCVQGGPGEGPQAAGPPQLNQ